MTITLQDVQAYRTIHALNDLNARTGLLRCTHYATVLSGGSAPVWAVFSAQTGKVLQFFGSRRAIETAFPKKSWRTKQATWRLGAVAEPLDSDVKLRAMTSQIGGKPMREPVVPTPVEQTSVAVH